MDKAGFGFESADEMLQAGVGHPLEWTQVHADFIKVAERELESFCKEQDMSHAVLFSQLKTALASPESGASEYLPMYLEMLEYDGFVQQMVARAKEPAMRARALAAAKEATESKAEEGGVSGLWVNDPERFDTEGFDSFLAGRDVPTLLRKIALRTLSTTQFELLVALEGRGDGAALDFAFTVPPFGARNMRLRLGERTTVVVPAGFARKGGPTRVVEASLTSDGDGNERLEIRRVRPDDPPGSFRENSLQMHEGGRSCRWTQRTVVEGEELVSFSLHMTRHDGGRGAAKK